MSEVNKTEVVNKSEASKKHESENIWDDIKDRPIAMFSLPNQTIKQHIVPLPVPGKQLIVKLVSTAVLPSLEQALSPKYKVEVAEGYIIIKEEDPAFNVKSVVDFFSKKNNSK